MNSDVLTSLGLDRLAAKIYLSALSLGTASVQELAQKAGMKRPTAYGYIEVLLKEGMLEKVPIGKRTYFRPTSPKILEARAEQNLQAIKVAMPELEAMRASLEGRPNISILEGEKGLTQVYDEMVIANSLCFWSSLEAVERFFPSAFKKLSESVRERQIRTREIIPNTTEARRSSKRYASVAGRSYSSRLATVEGIQNDNAVFGNVVAIFRLHESNLFVVRIEDPMIAQTMKALFEMAWKSAEVYIN